MPYDEGVAQRVREALDQQLENNPGARAKVLEKKMFGGLAFMVNGNMCCGVQGSTLMLRIGPDQYKDALQRPHARAMDFTGKPLKGFLYVDEPGFEDDADLNKWIERALGFAGSLPAKKK